MRGSPVKGRRRASRKPARRAERVGIVTSSGVASAAGFAGVAGFGRRIGADRGGRHAEARVVDHGSISILSNDIACFLRRAEHAVRQRERAHDAVHVLVVAERASRPNLRAADRALRRLTQDEIGLGVDEVELDLAALARQLDLPRVGALDALSLPMSSTAWPFAFQSTRAGRRSRPAARLPSPLRDRALRDPSCP